MRVSAGLRVVAGEIGEIWREKGRYNADCGTANRDRSRGDTEEIQGRYSAGLRVVAQPTEIGGTWLGLRLGLGLGLGVGLGLGFWVKVGDRVGVGVRVYG